MCFSIEGLVGDGDVEGDDDRHADADGLALQRGDRRVGLLGERQVLGVEAGRARDPLAVAALRHRADHVVGARLEAPVRGPACRHRTAHRTARPAGDSTRTLVRLPPSAETRTVSSMGTAAPSRRLRSPGPGRAGARGAAHLARGAPRAGDASLLQAARASWPGQGSSHPPGRGEAATSDMRAETTLGHAETPMTACRTFNRVTADRAERLRGAWRRSRGALRGAGRVPGRGPAVGSVGVLSAVVLEDPAAQAPGHRARSR